MKKMFLVLSISLMAGPVSADVLCDVKQQTIEVKFAPGVGYVPVGDGLPKPEYSAFLNLDSNGGQGSGEIEMSGKKFDLRLYSRKLKEDSTIDILLIERLNRSHTSKIAAQGNNRAVLELSYIETRASKKLFLGQLYIKCIRSQE